MNICKYKRIDAYSGSISYSLWCVEGNDTLYIHKVSESVYDSLVLPEIETLNPLNQIRWRSKYYTFDSPEYNNSMVLYENGEFVIYKQEINGTHVEYDYFYKDNVEYEIVYTDSNLDYIEEL